MVEHDPDGVSMPRAVGYAAGRDPETARVYWPAAVRSVRLVITGPAARRWAAPDRRSPQACHHSDLLDLSLSEKVA
jgi:hypothetical protein